jgi:hypothetical protein
VRGASALEGILERTSRPLTVLVIWEPVLPTDSRPPDHDTLALLADSRVRQYWDPGHLLSNALRDGMQAHPTSIPIDRRRTRGATEDVLWDAVAIFSPGRRWQDRMPAPDYLDGDVVDIVSALAKWLGASTK